MNVNWPVEMSRAESPTPVLSPPSPNASATMKLLSFSLRRLSSVIVPGEAIWKAAEPVVTIQKIDKEIETE